MKLKVWLNGNVINIVPISQEIGWSPCPALVKERVLVLKKKCGPQIREAR